MSALFLRGFLVSAISLVLAFAARAANPPPTQLFYVPFPEDQQLEGFDAINGAANDPIAVFVTFSAATDGTVIYYDHWEDGYERDVTNPVQATTLVFGDGNSANGYPPGNAGDLIPAGTVFNLRNFVVTSTLQSVLDYDARDKIAAFKPISVTKTCFPDGTDTLMAGCVELFEKGLWGTEYRSPVGVDMPTSAASGNLTFDENVFSYVAFSLMAGPGGASVQIDKNNDGVFEETVVLAEGESVYRENVNVGGRVLADQAVQVILFSGTAGSNYASRDTTLLPVYRWATEYYAPVTTPLGNGTVTYLYNPGASPITVSYDYRDSDSTYVTASVSVPAGGNTRVTMAPADGSTHFGAYRFYTTGAEPALFYAMSAIDADASSGSNQAWDGGFTLVGKPSLTTQVLLSLGIGRDPYSSTNPAENGNPVWITTSGNGHVQETVYVDHNGDNAGAFTDPNGNHYDVSHDLRELQQLKLYDPDGDQSGMLVYTLNPAVRIAAVWGQDPATASVAQPGLDVASLVPPLREGAGGKNSSLKVDADGDGYLSPGDTLEYDIRAVNTARSSIPGPFTVQDDFPADTTYVPGSTRYRFAVGGAWQAWVAIADDPSGTPFPLDGPGFLVPGNLGVGQEMQVVFLAEVDGYESLSGDPIVNTGQVEISPYGLVLPIEWEDIVYGKIGDRVWNDLNGDGVQEPGEDGIPGIFVFIDSNGNATLDPDERHDVTDSNGDYVLAGLDAGTYTVRVDAADIASVNVGYGPTFDPDGVSTSHSAEVTLVQAESRMDADFGYRVGASVGDRVWADLNADGAQNVGEPGVVGARVYVDLNHNNSYDIGEPNTLTSGDGAYYIGNLDPGTYGVRVETSTLPAGATQTFDPNGALDHEASVTLVAAEHQSNLDFGYRGNLSIGDFVWEDADSNGIASTGTTYNISNGRIDLNGDGFSNDNDDGFLGGMRIINGYADIDNDNSTPTDNGDDGVFLGVNIVNGGFDMNGNGGINNQDDGQVVFSFSEPGIPGVRVFIDADDDGAFDPDEASSITDADGFYEIGYLFGGDYIVRVDPLTLPASYVQTHDLVSPGDDNCASFTLGPAGRDDVDFGYRNDASIGDLVWNDLDGDGVRDAGEPGIEGALVYLDVNGNNIFDQASETAAVTDVDGIYLFENLSAGAYSVRIEISTLPQGAVQTYDLNGSTDHEAARTLVGTEDATDVDFGYRASAGFGDRVWSDADADGLQDAGESGISGVRVFADVNGNGLFDSAIEPSAITDSGGAYSIGGLVPGTYTVRVDAATLPSGVVQTFDAVGAFDNAATFFISASQVRNDIDFGYTTPVLIGDLVWNDQDGNGLRDAGEPGIQGVTVTVFNAATDAVAGTTTTGADGSYAFASLLPGTYYLVFDPVAGFHRSPADAGADSSDSDSAADTGRTPDVTLTGGQSDITLDAGYYQSGSISGRVLADSDGDGGGETPLPGVVIDLLDAAGETVLDSLGVPVTATTGPAGFYNFDLLRQGGYRVSQRQPAGYASVSDVDGANNNLIGDETPVLITPGAVVANRDFVEVEFGSIGGTVLKDSDGDGSGDTAFAGVGVELLNGSGVSVATATTGSDGTYLFSGLLPGDYQVSEIQPGGYGSVSDADGGDVDLIGNLVPIAVLPGLAVGGQNFVDVELGGISGYVFDGSGPLAGVTLTLLYANGDPVDRFPDIPGLQVFTVTTDGSGYYSFKGLLPDTYLVSETQPFGYDSFGDADGGDPNLIGDVTPIVLLPGDDSLNNNFAEIPDTCPDDWAEWKQQHPGEQADGNPDADAYDNLAEFAFAMPAESGAGNAWLIQPSTLLPGALEGVFTRPKGAADNVTYVLEYAANPGNPTVWQSIAITPAMIAVVDNGDCTETVTIDGLEAVTGLTGGEGFVRIKAELDEEADGITDHTSHTEVEGWKLTGLELCCRTYNNPFLRETAFTGTVSGVSGQDLSFAVSGGDYDLATLPGSGSYYLEVTSGDNEGHRFDIAAASGDTITLANDADLHSVVAPFNTLTGTPPADLAGDRVVIRRHWSLDEVFPPSGFGATGSQSDADQVQFFAGGAWTIYWLYDENDADPGTARWVDAADSGMADRGGVIIPPGQGLFVNNRTNPGSILAYGELRENDFVRPLAAGNNLVGGGFPVDQAPAGTGGRAMNPAQGFFGSRDFKTADSFFVWNADTTVGAVGYATYYLLDGAPVQPALLRWVKVGDASILPRDAEALLLGNRSVFVRTKDAIPVRTVPSPWSP